MPAFAASARRAPDVAPASPAETVVRADSKSGRLIRTTIPVVSSPVPETEVTPSAVSQNPLPAADLASLVNQIALEQGVEDSLVHSVIRAESNYNARAVSPKGAQGIMQLIPSTARRFGVVNAFDPKDNIQGGVRYLRFLLDYYGNDYARTIAAYNAGEGAVDKYHGVPPYPETQNYVVRVARNLKTARQIRARQAVPEPATAEMTATIAETHRPIQTSIGEDGRVYYRTP
ncbi:MAG: lytic transglycosylase domain-containing protein [Acidobacteriota bacterium]